MLAQAPPHRREPGAAQQGDKAAPAAVVPYKESRLAMIDEELAALLQRRGEAGSDAALLELQIDLRVLARGIAAGLSDKPLATPEAAATYLRLHQMLDAAAQVGATVKALPAPTAARATALKRLHELTYRSVDTATVAALDALCEEVAATLSTIVPAPAMPMRPAPVASPTTGATGDATLAALGAAARKLNVTPALRRQLVALADAAQRSGAGGNAGEARVLTVALADSLDLATGLATNTAVEPAKRQAIEAQLAQGLALYSDVRTRDAGRERLKVLAPFRQTVARVGRIRQNPDTARLGKLFVWAQENGDDGAQVLASVEAYHSLTGEFDGRERLTALPPNVKRAADAIVRRFQAARATFMEDAMGLPGGGMMAATPQQLEESVGAMRVAMDELALVESTPRSLDVLLAYKPKPPGALEKRAIAALQAMGDEGKMPRDEARPFLKSLAQLASVSQRIGTDLPTSAVEAAAWAGQGAGPLQARLSALLGEQATRLAAPDGTADDEALSQLRAAGDIADLLRRAKSIDDAVQRCAPLARWVDWGLDVPQLEAVVKPYRDGTSAAVDGLIGGRPEPVLQWPRIHAKYGPLVAYLQRMSDYAPGCAALPANPGAAVAKLATPLQAPEFAQVRLTGALLGLWGTAEQAADLTTANDAAALVNQQLAGE